MAFRSFEPKVPQDFGTVSPKRLPASGPKDCSTYSPWIFQRFRALAFSLLQGHSISGS